MPSREIFLRTDGRVRFVRISSRAQVLALAVVAIAALMLLLFFSFTLWSQMGMAVERSALARDRTQVSHQQAQVNAYRKSVDEVASEIEARQDALDQIVRSHLGTAQPANAPAAPAQPAPARKISSNVPGAQRLRVMQLRQSAFEIRLYAATQRRINQLEKAIRGFGVNPAHIAQSQAMGGPFIPAGQSLAQMPDLRNLSLALSRLRALEAGLAAMPSGRPTSAPMETSSYGYRRDPFNGLPAFHSGIDFPGSTGQPILAAADGKVSFVGVRSGYGNVVEIEHGNGFMTRYAHLSGFSAQPGQRIARGQALGRMGSTGRSTGTHLHFEVRVNGAAVDPRPFLEAREDVLEVQQIARRKRSGVGNGR